MPHPHRRHLVQSALLVAAGMSLGLSSCGFDTQTEQVYTPGEGVNNRSGNVDVLHALVVSGEDGSGTVVAALVNNDEASDDALVAVTGSGDDQSVSASGGPVTVPAGELVQLADEGGVSVSAERIEPGRFVSLSFEFESSESVSLIVPVVDAEGDYADVPLPSPSPIETPSDTES